MYSLFLSTAHFHLPQQHARSFVRSFVHLRMRSMAALAPHLHALFERHTTRPGDESERDEAKKLNERARSTETQRQPATTPHRMR